MTKLCKREVEACKVGLDSQRRKQDVVLTNLFLPRVLNGMFVLRHIALA